mmetsp:Transcript_7002/g.6185  ORF Transcript_7002/g.6185 Transcript_7002/m.6185 type:complete len:140 (-) Transcript_7002:107-526(-)
MISMNTGIRAIYINPIIKILGFSHNQNRMYILNKILPDPSLWLVDLKFKIIDIYDFMSLSLQGTLILKDTFYFCIVERDFSISFYKSDFSSFQSAKGVSLTNDIILIKTEEGNKLIKNDMLKLIPTSIKTNSSTTQEGD